MILPGNYYINGELVTADENGNIILGMYSKMILEFIGTLNVSYINQTTEEVLNTVTYISERHNNQPYYLNLYELATNAYHQNYDDTYVAARVKQFVDKSTIRIDFDLDGNKASFWFIATTDSYPSYCDDVFYGAEGEDIYIYFYAGKGEDPRIIDVDDPTSEATIECYAADNYGPRLDTQSREIEDWEQTISLSNPTVGATFFIEENIKYPGYPKLAVRDGVDVTVLDSVYPHEVVPSLNKISLRAPVISIQGIPDQYKTYDGSGKIYYDIRNFDFNDYVGYWLCVGDWHTEIIAAFDANDPWSGDTKHYVITQNMIFPQFGLVNMNSDGLLWRDMYAAEKIQGVIWTPYDVDGVISNIEAMSRLRTFLTNPFTNEQYQPQQQQLYTFEVYAEEIWTVTLTVNDIRFGYTEGSGRYEYGQDIQIYAFPYEGYEFIDWSDGNTSPIRTIIVRNNVNLSANFFPIMTITDFEVNKLDDMYRLTATMEDNIAERGFLLKYSGTPTIDDYDEIYVKTGTNISQDIEVEQDCYVCAYTKYQSVVEYSDVEQIVLSPIPAEYQLVEYIGARNAQYFNTGVVIDNIDTEFVVEYDIKVYPTSSVQYTGGNYYGFWSARANNTYGILSNGTIPVGNRDKVVLTRELEITTLTVNQTIAAVFSEPTSVSNIRFGMFRLGQNNYGWWSGNLMVCDLYYNKIVKNGVLVREFYPVYRKADNKPGMFDIVNNVFYTNEGTGEFIVGPDKQWGE